ncbi:hypothetical protein AB5I41_17100 [Sphingomonas sp. MMS24-JH45]
MRKTPAEIALMRLATDVTIAAYRFVYPRVEAGMHRRRGRRADDRRDEEASAGRRNSRWRWSAPLSRSPMAARRRGGSRRATSC